MFGNLQNRDYSVSGYMGVPKIGVLLKGYIGIHRDI